MNQTGNVRCSFSANTFAANVLPLSSGFVKVAGVAMNRGGGMGLVEGSKGAFEKATLSLYLWEWTKRNAQNAAKLRVFAAPGSAFFVKDFALQELQKREKEFLL